MQELHAHIESVGNEIISKQKDFTVKDYALLFGLLRRVITTCEQAYATAIYTHIVAFLPDELWLTIFNFKAMKIDAFNWLLLRTVSKQWYRVIPNLSKAFFAISCRVTPTIQKQCLAKFSSLRTIRIRSPEGLDFGLLSELKSLQLSSGYALPSMKLPVISIDEWQRLTQLRSLTVIGHETLINKSVTSLPTLVKERILSLKLLSNVEISNETLGQFTRLTKLTVLYSTAITSINALTQLRLLRTNSKCLRNFKDYTGNAIIIDNAHRYEGSVSKGEKNGYGVTSYANGDSYDGYYLNGKKHGHGTYNFVNGTRWQGEWCYDQFRGKKS